MKFSHILLHPTTEDESGPVADRQQLSRPSPDRLLVGINPNGAHSAPTRSRPQACHARAMTDDFCAPM